MQHLLVQRCLEALRQKILLRFYLKTGLACHLLGNLRSLSLKSNADGRKRQQD
ncbi:MAG: hypothetical protein ACI85V_003333 [bacterium]|jgi:hypothetical protein